MGILEKIDYKKVFFYFEEISKIPRGSRNNKAISDYLVEFAKKHKLQHRQDEFLNVLMIKEATPGYESCPTVIIQGHMDMVCEKNVDTEHDFMKDPLNLAIEDDFIFAKGTTLGGDDGIAIAYALAILDSNEYKHPRLEVLITTDEEIGMDGAIGLDASDLKGTFMLNIDSEEEGIILSSAAGGLTGTVNLPIERTYKGGILKSIKITGLQGGHSGTEIHKNRINANVLMGRFLLELSEVVDFDIIGIQGGLKDNAIPRESFADILVMEDNSEKADKAIALIIENLKNEFSVNEPGLQISIIKDEKNSTNVLTDDSQQIILFYINNAPNGVQSMSASIEGLVESSLNLGILTTNDNNMEFSYSVRSSVNGYKNYLSTKLGLFAKQFGGKYTKRGEYPAWEYKNDSKLRKLLCNVYEKEYGEQPQIMAIHAGLECGIIASKLKNVDIASLGPNIYDIHTPQEKISISSTVRVFDYVVHVLEAFKEI